MLWNDIGWWVHWKFCLWIVCWWVVSELFLLIHGLGIICFFCDYGLWVVWIFLCVGVGLAGCSILGGWACPNLANMQSSENFLRHGPPIMSSVTAMQPAMTAVAKHSPRLARSILILFWSLGRGTKTHRSPQNCLQIFQAWHVTDTEFGTASYIATSVASQDMFWDWPRLRRSVSSLSSQSSPSGVSCFANTAVRFQTNVSQPSKVKSESWLCVGPITNTGAQSLVWLQKQLREKFKRAIVQSVLSLGGKVVLG